MMIIAKYLGKHVSRFLADTPFNNWQVEKSFEDDLEERIIHYVFRGHGLELRCDKDDNISVIFMYSDKYGCIDEALLEIPISATREQVREHFGSPSKSSGKFRDPVLGNYGAWDRFTRLGFAIHVEYRTDSERLKQITLMRTDVIS